MDSLNSKVSSGPTYLGLRYPLWNQSLGTIKLHYLGIFPSRGHQSFARSAVLVFVLCFGLNALMVIINCVLNYQDNGGNHKGSAKMAPPKLTLFLDIISPFAYMAFYVTKVSFPLCPPSAARPMQMFRHQRMFCASPTLSPCSPKSFSLLVSKR